jgi:hypothetical protein
MLHVKRLLLPLLGVVLVACAAQADPLIAEGEKACQTTTPDALLASMRQGGVKPAADLRGLDAARLAHWVAAQSGKAQPSPLAVDRAILFVNDPAVLIAWFNQGCFIGHATGPWEPTAKFLGIE